jgi:hypothetical protein|tara:strand:+ start:1877 stop:2011 length:135 start_codon:yes stop_codon:yes gene_type:complete
MEIKKMNNGCEHTAVSLTKEYHKEMQQQTTRTTNNDNIATHLRP